jgi:hypothetical protein
MVLDEPAASDEMFEIDGFTYLIDRALLAQAQPIEVDCTAFGFHITGNSDFQRGRGCR